MERPPRSDDAHHDSSFTIIHTNDTRCFYDGDSTERITASDFEYALSTVHSSVSRKDLREIERYRRTGGDPDSEEDYVPEERRLPGYW